MSTVGTVSEDKVAVLIWLKLLNDFNEGEFKDKSFNDKYLNFSVDNTGLTDDELISGFKFWVEYGVFKETTQGWVITEAGKKLFSLMEEDGAENSISEFIKNNNKKLDFKPIKDWVCTHYIDIIQTLSVCIQCAGFVVAVCTI